MALNVKAKWYKPVALIDGASEGLIYKLENPSAVPEDPGVYVFARSHGKSVTPIYIGRSVNVLKRVQEQLEKVKLMNSIKKSPNGKRIVLFCTVKPKPGQNAVTLTKVVERALIAHALAAGVDLVNIQGTRKKRHRITNHGNGDSRKVAPLRMLVDA